MRENMWVMLKVKATRHPCYSADNFLHSDRRWSEGELSTSVGGKIQNSLSTLYRRVTKNGYDDNKNGFDNVGLLGSLNKGTRCYHETSVTICQPTS